MNTVHIYPGLHFKSRPMNPEVLGDPLTQLALGEASNLTGIDVDAVCRQTPRYFRSIEECFVVTAASSVAVGRYYVQRNREPDLIMGSSFGHYPGLVMAGSLEFEETLRLVQTFGRTIDNYFAYFNYVTMQVENSTFAAVARILEASGQSFTIFQHEDGLNLTATTSGFATIQSDIESAGGNLRRIPLRLPFHSLFLQEPERIMWENQRGLNIRAPRTQFLSASTAQYLSSAEDIRSALKREMSLPHKLRPTMSILGKITKEATVILPTGYRKFRPTHFQ